MQILLFPSTYTCLNMGDVAMLQIAVRRLTALWPTAKIHVITKDAKALVTHCPEASPLIESDWFTDHYLLGGLHRLLPSSISKRLIALRLRTRRRWPSLEHAAIQFKLRLRGRDLDSFKTYVETFDNADLVVISGACGIGDTFPSFSYSVLRVLERAVVEGKPTAVFSHGFSQIRGPRLLRKAKEVLPLVNLIALREPRTGPPLLKSLGVDEQRVIITGDDALEMAYESRSSEFSGGLGLNIRTFEPARLEPRDLDQIRAVILDFTSYRRVPIIPLPIARQQNLDAGGIQQLLQGVDRECDGGLDLDTPEKVVRQVRKCRVVVTGAYHAAVFALGQGIPAVCLAKSDYFLTKFLGLADLFPGGCHVVLLTGEDVPARLRSALDLAWESAEQIRPKLLANTLAQTEKGIEAYSRVKELVEFVASPSNRTDCLVEPSTVDGAVVAS
jgi:colanic acid/amylovoran biosynthesis protein